ncbi:AGAP004541-PA-like protein [Anopheles sinensis]|uniref:AGAP004541-PA-like protein n=1 Tax=Anopheles sinensis TaxID=74873 RepID=A0A084WTV8_ANOSI|nr:AGAP004541-PA-like protein [Anopheles sinensis]
MDDTVRCSVLERPDDTFDTAESSYQDYSVNAFGLTEGDGCCRLCCSDDCRLRELFPGGYREEVLLRKIFDCTTVQISQSEDSDALICFACVGKVEDFFQYREQCRTNDVLQRKWKRRLGRTGATATTSLLPAVSIKREVEEPEKDFFRPSELIPLDAQPSHSSLDSSANAFPSGSNQAADSVGLHANCGS